MIRKLRIFKVSVISFFYVLPVISIGIDYFCRPNSIITDTVIKWITFWSIGMRLFTCGLSQSFNPEFTASKIFNSNDKKAFPIVRELGYANVSLGICGILSLYNKNLRMTSILIGLIYYSMAFIQHLLRTQKNLTEVFATITDLTIIVILGILVIFVLLS